MEIKTREFAVFARTTPIQFLAVQLGRKYRTRDLLSRTGYIIPLFDPACHLAARTSHIRSMSSDLVTRTKQGAEGLVQKTTEAIQPPSEPDLNPWSGTPMTGDAEYKDSGEALSKEDFERIGKEAEVRHGARSA